MWFYTKATPTNDTNHIKVAHIVQPIIWSLYDATTHYILVANYLRADRNLQTKVTRHALACSSMRQAHNRFNDYCHCNAYHSASQIILIIKAICFVANL